MMTETEKAYLNWKMYGIGSKMLINALDENDEDVDHVIGIARGGLPLAIHASHILEASVGVVWATHYDGTERKEGVEVDNYGMVDVEDGNSILIIDDIVDTGKTMEAVVERTRNQGVVDVEVTTASMHVKPDREFDPDYWAEETDKWVVYPWEYMRPWDTEDNNE